MNDIRCPHCKKAFKADDVFSQHLAEERKKFEEEKTKLRNKAEEWKEATEKELRVEAEKARKRDEDELRKKLREEISIKLKDTQNESLELKDQNKALQEQILELNKLMREMNRKQEAQELENQKKLASAEDTIKVEAKKHAEEQARFKILEYEKKLNDAVKANDDLRRKLEQGSQQMQGEVLELELEKLLMQEFPFDEVKPVPKGIRGADILHVVRNGQGLQCGVILWELKRTKAWSNEWVAKLKEDQRSVHADCAVIISQIIPDAIKMLGEIQGIIVGEYVAILGIAKLIRSKLIEAALLRSASHNSDEKKDILYKYVTSKEFRHRIEAIAESFNFQQNALEAEKRWFAKKWSNQEKALRKMIDNTYGIRGELEVIMGKELEGMHEMDMLPGEIEVEVTAEESAEQSVEETLFK